MTQQGTGRVRVWRLVGVIVASVVLPVACSAGEQTTPTTTAPASSVSAPAVTSAPAGPSTDANGALVLDGQQRAGLDLVFAVENLIEQGDLSRAAWAAGRSAGDGLSTAGVAANTKVAAAQAYPGLAELVAAAQAVQAAEAATIADLIQSKSVSAASEQALADALDGWERAKASAGLL